MPDIHSWSFQCYVPIAPLISLFKPTRTGEPSLAIKRVLTCSSRDILSFPATPTAYVYHLSP